MTVESTTRRNDYLGTGSTATYDYSFRIFAETDLRVTVQDTNGVETTLSYPADYSVTGVGLYNGGTITLTAGNLASNYRITIRGNLPLTQGASIRNQGGYFPDVIEKALDRNVMIDLQQQDEIDRSVKLPETETGSPQLPTLANRISKFLAFDASGNMIGASGVPSVPVSSFMATVLDDTDAASARATLRLMNSGICEGRITLTSQVPVTTSDVTAATLLYWTPYKGNRIALYDGASYWNLFSFAEISFSVPALYASKMYDLFAYNNAGAVNLEALAWTNDTTRATALVTQDGVLVKSGATTRRYLGSFRTTAAGGQTEDSLAKRYVWNYYNRIVRPMQVLDTTDAWTYSSATIRQARASAANQLDYIQGIAEDRIYAEVAASASTNQAEGSIAFFVGIGIDSTTANSAQIIPIASNLGNAAPQALRAVYRGSPGVGRHTLAWLESTGAIGTTTWYGDNGYTSMFQSGIQGELLG